MMIVIQVIISRNPRSYEIDQGSAQDCWSAYIFSTKVQIQANGGFLAEWWSGPTSADQQGQNTGRSQGESHQGPKN
jgi:hypothetical protein